MKTLLLSCLLLLFFAGRASAQEMDTISQSGLWGTSCPPVVCSHPGDSWSYSFESPVAMVPLDEFGYDSTRLQPITTAPDFNFYPRWITRQL